MRSSRSVAFVCCLAAALSIYSTLASAQQAPAFLRDTYPPQALASTLQDMASLNASSAALGQKQRQLIGLAVAASVPCQYCVYFHTKAAKAAGASDAELKEAVAAAAETRKMSAVLYGNMYDMAAFRAEVDAMFGRK